jgi:multidrug resistance protein, MATE family
MIGHSLVGFIDNIMVGQIGPTELAAVSLGNSFIFIAMSIGIGFSTAITPIVAGSYGANRIEENKITLYSSLFLCTLLGVVLFALIYFLKPLIGYMGQPKEVVALAGPYLDIVAFSLIPLIVFQAYKQFADGESETKISMYVTIIANIINVVVNYIFIFGFWIFPKMGVIGAAIGTITSRFVMVFLIHYFLAIKPKFKSYFQAISWALITKTRVFRIVNLGFLSALQMFFEVALFTGAIWLSGLLGTFEQAANQIALSISAMTYMVAMGLSVAAMIRVGNQAGKFDYKQLQIVARSIFLLAALFALSFAIIFVSFHEFLPKIYFDLNDTQLLEANSEVISIAANLLLIAAVFQLSDSLQIVVLGALRGLQDVKIPTVLTFVAYWLVGFPVCIYLGIFTELKAVGIWIGLFLGLTVSSLLLYLRFQYVTKKLLIQSL